MMGFNFAKKKLPESHRYRNRASVLPEKLQGECLNISQCGIYNTIAIPSTTTK